MKDKNQVSDCCGAEVKEWWKRGVFFGYEKYYECKMP